MTLPKRVVRTGFTAGGAELGLLALGSPLVAAENTGSAWEHQGTRHTAQHNMWVAVKADTARP